MNRQPFGRRTTHQESFQATKSPAETHSGIPSERTGTFKGTDFAFGTAEANSVDDELREWKKARRKHYRLPWRQISIMASICFGVGSIVLPNSVNHIVQWFLYALGALSLIAGFSTSRRTPG